jgi:membrane protein
MKRLVSSSVSGIGSTLRYYLKGVFKRFNQEDILFLSSGVAFNIILCLLPLLLLLTSLLGMVINSSHFPSQKIDDMLNTVFPPQPYAQKIKTSIKEVVYDIVRYRSTFGFSGIGVLLWTATSLFSSIRTVLNKIYRISESKLVIIKILEHLLLVIVLGALFLVANAFTWMFLLIESVLKDVTVLQEIHITGFVKSISFVASYVPALVMFFVINRFIPDKRIDSKVALVAALTTTSLWWIAGKGFGVYLATFHSYNTLYGAYAFFLVFLVWVYYSSIIFVLGVVVGQLYRERLLMTNQRD